jgi:hypothetical protein
MDSPLCDYRSLEQYRSVSFLTIFFDLTQNKWVRLDCYNLGLGGASAKENRPRFKLKLETADFSSNLSSENLYLAIFRIPDEFLKSV